LQANRRCKGKQKINIWDLVVSKLKVKFMPKDYHINFFKRMKNLRQRGFTVKEYTQEFYKLNIRARQRERDEEKVARYNNGLRYYIQNEISMATTKTLEDAYQIALKKEEKLANKKS
jgi:hypothetical protein